MALKRNQNRIWRALMSAIGIIAALLAAAPGRADVIIMAQPATAASPSSANTFDIDLQNTGSSDLNIAGFSFEISTTDTNITFTSADISTAAPYIFNGHSLFGPTISIDSGQTLDASDNYDIFNAGATVAAGATVGLGRISFDVAGGDTTSPITVTITPDPFTSLSDADGDTVAITSLVNGQITLAGGQAPEPGGMFLPALALLAGAFRAKRTRR